MSLESTKFGEFLQRQRVQQNINRDQLGEGLYTPDMMGKVENGLRYPEKLMRDRLIARLGETGFDYECYLQHDEYEQWEERLHIIESLDNRELDRAEELLEQYYKKNDMDQKVTRQFWLTMRVQWMELKREPEEERCILMEEAVKLTVPKVDDTPVSELLLSVQELNLVLEYVTYKKVHGLEEKYLDLLQYLEAERFDLESRARLCSKIALFYCRWNKEILKKEKSIARRQLLTEKALKICTYGIECLRNHKKLYFAWELLQRQMEYLTWLLEHRKLLSGEAADRYEKELEQASMFFHCFDKLYEEYQVPKETNGYTCFYREYEVYCINDVIRARKKMFGVSKKELEDICGESTLKRLEKNKGNIQMPIAQKLFERFHLSMEMHRAQIVTEKQEALRIEKEFRNMHNQRAYEKTELLLQRLKSMIFMEDLTNKQYICYEEKMLLYKKGLMKKDEFISCAIEILNYTVSLEAVMEKIRDVKLPNGRIQKGEKYLTNTEVTILNNIANEVGSSTENVYWTALQEYFEWLEKKCTLSPIIGMYGFVMTSIASYLGNIGNYTESCNINRKILKELLKLRNARYLHGNLYGLLWNDRKQKGLPMEKEDPIWRQGLLECLAIDIYCKDKFREDKIRKKMEM